MALTNDLVNHEIYFCGGKFFVFVCLFVFTLFILEKPLSDHEKDFRTHKKIDRYDTPYNH